MGCLLLGENKERRKAHACALSVLAGERDALGGLGRVGGREGRVGWRAKLSVSGRDR